MGTGVVVPARVGVGLVETTVGRVVAGILVGVAVGGMMGDGVAVVIVVAVDSGARTVGTRVLVGGGEMVGVAVTTTVTVM